MNHETDCIICMNPTNINTLCCNKKLCNTCNYRVTEMNQVNPLCPNCRRDLIIDDYITKNNALNLYDLRIHKRFIPIKPAKTITIQSLDDHGNREIISTERVPAEYDDELIKYVSKNTKIQKALVSNENILFARNKKHPNKYIFLKEIDKGYYIKPYYKPILFENYKNIPLRYLDSNFFKKLSEKILYFKDTNIPLIPKSKQFILTIANQIIISNKGNLLLKNLSLINYMLKFCKSTIREAQKMQARRIGFQKKRDAEVKAKEERSVLKKIDRKNTQRVIKEGEFPSRRNIKVGDIHITPTGDKGVCAGFNLWKYKSGKIIYFKNNKWNISEKVCKVDDLCERFKNILLKA